MSDEISLDRNNCWLEIENTQTIRNKNLKFKNAITYKNKIRNKVVTKSGIKPVRNSSYESVSAISWVRQTGC